LPIADFRLQIAESHLEICNLKSAICNWQSAYNFSQERPVIEFLSRQRWTVLTDEQLLAQCQVDTYRASGPGGQKRNKTSSAVRLRHPPSGLLVIAEESRSQHENKARALRRLRQALFLRLRDELAAGTRTPDALATRPELAAVRTAAGRLVVGRKDPRFWPAAGLVLDVLQAATARVSDAARLLGVSTGNLIDFLQTDPKLWEQANALRQRFGQKPLKSE
jgi:RF-1 domain